MGTNKQRIKIVWEKNFELGRLEQPRKDKNLLYRHDKANEPTKAGPLSFVLFESPFTSVSTVSRGHPSLVSLIKTNQRSRRHVYNLFSIPESKKLFMNYKMKLICFFYFK
jgi:hypothetical protein